MVFALFATDLKQYVCVCVLLCVPTMRLGRGTVWATPGLEQLLSREHRLPLSGLKFKTKSADNDPTSHCIREAACHWQDQVTGYEQALPSSSLRQALRLPVIMTAGAPPGGVHPRPLALAGFLPQLWAKGGRSLLSLFSPILHAGSTQARFQ